MRMDQHPAFEGGQDIRDRSFEYAKRAAVKASNAMAKPHARGHEFQIPNS
jgi:hypothetical protein